MPLPPHTKRALNKAPEHNDTVNEWLKLYLSY